MSGPLVSVVLPTYRRPDMLGQALDSVLGQTFDGWECIVVDDGSGDETRTIIEKWTGPDSRFRALELEHSGFAGRTRNAGILAARGRWIAFLDDDDVWLPHRLERQIAAAEQETGATMFCARTELFGGKSGRWPCQDLPGILTFELLLEDNQVATSTVLVKTEAVRQAGGFNETLHAAEGWELWLRLARRHMVRFLDETVARRRYTAGSLTRQELRYCDDQEQVIRLAQQRGWLTPTTFREKMRGLHGRRAAAHSNPGPWLYYKLRSLTG